MLFTRARTRTNPVFYADRAQLRFAHDPQRFERMQHDDDSVDLLVWNTFASFGTDRDRPYLAGQLQALTGERLRAPLSLSLFSGKHSDPLLRPSHAYQAFVKKQSTSEAYLAEATAPIEVPVRIESPELLVLVDAMIDVPPTGATGRDRLIELVDAGAQHAHAISKQLVVAVLYRSGSRGAREVSARLQQLRDAQALREAMPWRDRAVEVDLRELSWQRLLALWEQNSDGMQLSRQPVKRFLEYAEKLELR